jgi:beta-glucosidase
MVYAYQGYLDGTFPPNEQREGPKAVTPVRDALLMMHAAAYRAIHDDAKRRRSNASVGFAQHVRAFMPWRDLNPLDRFTANAIDKMFITDFIDGARGLMDYVGVNFYGRSYVKTKLTDPTHFEILHHDQNDPNEDQSDLGWAADEEALTDTLARFHERYGLPQYVLENGTADSAIDDARRQRGLVRHTQAIWRAVQHHHADVRGYFHWSLIDNFEWAEGFGPRFGLYAVDYERDFARTPRKSVDVYKQIASHNALPAALWRRFRR